MMFIYRRFGGGRECLLGFGGYDDCDHCLRDVALYERTGYDVVVREGSNYVAAQA